MTTERWLQIEALFAEALDRPAEARAAFLDAACEGDADLRTQVERLLAGHRTTAGLLDTPPTALAALRAPANRSVEDDLVGTTVGAYRIECLIGRGGMGQVYLANRADGAFEQQAAVKVLRRGLDTDDVLLRFRAERQILAGLQHPNIARLLDGGATPDGRPYLVLEYVEGTPLTRYADAHALSLDARLRLFLTVCAAVQAAHQALVVHRDLKPSNILVAESDGGRPDVKLLDFGIAKLLDPGTEQATPRTRTDVRLMTPAYASPEQVRGQPITTASDVYALGVVLYELLTGHRPYQLDTPSPAEVERIICEQEPARPSAIVVQADDRARGADALARERGTTADRLQRHLRGDLDTILLKALHKEPDRRYGSAAALADDLQRHREGLPVVARPDTLAYRLGRFVRRHRVGVGAAALIALLVIGGAVVTGVQAARIQAQAVAVEQERDRAEEVLGFLLDLFAAADPTGQRGTDVTARELLAAGRRLVEQDLEGQPAVQAAMMDAMGRVYLSLGAYDDADALASQAFRLRRDLHGTEHADLAQSLHLLGRVAAERSQLSAADSLLSQSLAVRRRLLPPVHADLTQNLVDLGWIRLLRGDYDAADALNSEALALRRQGADSAAVAEVLNNLGILRRRQGDLEAAARMHRDALALRRRHYGALHYAIGQSLNNLAIVREDQGRHAEAESLLTAALPHYQQGLGPDHPDVLNALGNLAKSRFYQNDYAGADSLFRRILGAYRAQFGGDHRQIALTLHDLGEIQHRWGRLDNAEGLFRDALAMRRRVYGDTHREVAWSLNDLALVRRDQGARAEADALLRQALAMQEALPNTDRDRAVTLRHLADGFAADARYAEAEPLYREAVALATSDGRDAIETARALLALGRCLAALGRADEAERLLTTSLDAFLSRRGEDDPDVQAARAALAALRAVGNS